MLFAISVNAGDPTFIKVDSVLAYEKTDYAQIGIFETRNYLKTLFLDGEIQTCELSYADYHFKMVLPIDGLGKKALVLGAGEGCSINLLLRYGFEVDAVDIDEKAIDLYAKHIGEWNEEVYSKPKRDTYNLHFGCGVDFIQHCSNESYDYVILDFDTKAQRELAPTLVPEIYRVLKPLGIFSAQDDYAGNPSIVEPYAEPLFAKGRTTISKYISEEWRFTHYVKDEFGIVDKKS